jgi:DNA mismatch repair protein MutS
MSEQTPLMKQYRSVKEKHSDAIVFFRLGDFYEMFGEDAKTASKVLQIALTTRDKGKEDAVPMCGVPYFAADSYITKLIKAGYKVAVCEQVEDPKEAKGVVKREVVRVITPGTHTPEHHKVNNYILSFMPQGKKYGIAVADVSTGEFFVYETEEPIIDEIYRFEPTEVIFPGSLAGDIYHSEALKGFYANPLDDFQFDYGEAYKALLKHFRVSSLDGFGCGGLTVAISASGALISYLGETQKDALSFKKLIPLKQGSYMFLDASTQRNLELIHNLKDGSTDETLLSVLDETLTPMGGRYLRNAVQRPLVAIEEIKKRLNSVGFLYDDYELMDIVRKNLRLIQDIERLSSRVAAGSANARDLIAIKQSVSHLPEIRNALSASEDPCLKAFGEGIADFSALQTLIGKAIVERPPVGLRDGGIIKNGYHAEIDELRSLSKTGKDFITKLEAEEKRKTGISSLKVGFNRIFGYYIEVTKANLDLVPDNYMRKQTLVSGERFITPELKEYESKVLGAEERLKGLEYEVFMCLQEEAKKEAQGLADAARRLAAVDFLSSLSVVAKRHNYVMPHIDESSIIKIIGGRHPVLERLPLGERFIPNDIYMDNESNRLLIITGPNMAGKSTYMRQVALCVLMAQIGSFVPAEYAVVAVVDRIFTRIGASDFLTRGQSTFMVEMIETANILNNATEKSLVILDEVGRGTSTFDGISIAWATAEYIAKELKTKTLFATHYNELTELALTLEGVRNYNVSVKEWGDEIIFLRKIEKGPADKSYGIQVARLAGIPDSVLERAKGVLTNLEKQELNETGMPRFSPSGTDKARRQLDLFSGRRERVIEELLKLNPDAMTPDEAMKKLKELKKKAEDG